MTPPPLCMDVICVCPLKDLGEASKSVEKERSEAKQKLESIARERDESLRKVKEESAAEAAREAIQWFKILWAIFCAIFGPF